MYLISSYESSVSIALNLINKRKIFLSFEIKVYILVVLKYEETYNKTKQKTESLDEKKMKKDLT